MSNIFFSIPVIIAIAMIVLIGLAINGSEAATAYAGLGIIYLGLPVLGFTMLCLVAGFSLRAKSKPGKGDVPKRRRLVLGSCAIAAGAIILGYQLFFLVKVFVFVPQEWLVVTLFWFFDPRLALALGALIFGTYQLRKSELNAAS